MAVSFEPFVAVDVGSYSLKFLWVTRDENETPFVKAMAQFVFPNWEKELSEDQLQTMSREDVRNYCQKKLRQFLTKHLTELLYDNKIDTKRCITFASNREVTIRSIEIIPVAEKDKLEEAVKTEANKQMPFSTGNAVIGFKVQGDTARDGQTLTQVMVGALQKTVIDEVNQNIKGAGLLNEGILTLPQALEISLKGQLIPYSENNKKVALIHCGNQTTSIMIYKNAKLQFYRDINMAGSTITDEIFAGGELEDEIISFEKYEQAVEFKHKIGILPPEEMNQLNKAEKFVAQKIFECVEKIFQHIQLSISFYISQTGESGLDQIVLTGGSASMINFKEFIEESLEVPTVIAQPFANVETEYINNSIDNFDEQSPALAPTVGIALYKGEKEIINFMDILFPNRAKGQSASLSTSSSKFSVGFNKNIFEMNETKLRIIAGIILSVLMIIALYPAVKIRREVSRTKQEFRAMQNELSALKREDSELSALLSEQDSIKKYAQFADHSLKLKTGYSYVLLEIASITPSQIFITEARVDSDPVKPSIKLKGHADNSDSVFEYMQTISGSEIFSQPFLDSTREREIDDERFFIEFSLDFAADLSRIQEQTDYKTDDDHQDDIGDYFEF